VWVLAITLTFQKKEDLDSFLVAWRDIADHSRRNEPNLIAFELSFSESDPLQILVFER